MLEVWHVGNIFLFEISWLARPGHDGLSWIGTIEHTVYPMDAKNWRNRRWRKMSLKISLWVLAWKNNSSSTGVYFVCVCAPESLRNGRNGEVLSRVADDQGFLMVAQLMELMGPLKYRRIRICNAPWWEIIWNWRLGPWLQGNKMNKTQHGKKVAKVTHAIASEGTSKNGFQIFQMLLFRLKIHRISQVGPWLGRQSIWDSVGSLNSSQQSNRLSTWRRSH